MSASAHAFVEWQEHFVSQERGSRVVHYYLKDATGDSVLAVVGTERSIRHMLYVVAEKFLQDYGSEKSINTCLKWRSKREVVDWLTSWVSQQHPSRDCSKTPTHNSGQVVGSPNFSMNRLDASGAHPTDHKEEFARTLEGHHSDILWLGDGWICGKQLKHYPAFRRDGTNIANHSFVLIMSKEHNHYLAYLEDMYEDKKEQKKVKVRWFHHNKEVKNVISLPNPHPREIFITPHSQVLSAECVDGPATVLTPEHYEKCMAVLPQSAASRVYLCFRQFRSNKVKPFDLSKLWGYFDQEILSCLEEEEEFSQGGTVKQGTKRTRSCRGHQKSVASRSGATTSGCGNQITTAREPENQNLGFGLLGPRAIKFVGPQPSLPPFKVDEKIEFLCQDSGIRGCWFMCTILKVSQKRLKVLYDDIQDAEECGNLEEWIPAIRVAAPDKLGMRCSGRLTIRPRRPPENPTDGVFDIGAAVDAWWHDGWWEGVVTQIDNRGGDVNLQVYFPGEDRFSTFQRRDIRSSMDWVGNEWVDIKAKPDILSSISAAVSPGMKLSACLTVAKGTESGGSAISDREVPSNKKIDEVVEDKQELVGSAGFDNLPENLKRLRIDDKGKRT